MVRANRVKEINFTGSELTANTGAHVYAVTRPINGTVQKIEFKAGNYGANGSIILQISGLTNETIWKRNGTANTDAVAFPHVFTVDNANVTGSPNIASQRVCNNPLILTCSGVGANKSGLGMSVFYI